MKTAQSVSRPLHPGDRIRRRALAVVLLAGAAAVALVPGCASGDAGRGAFARTHPPAAADAAGVDGNGGNERNGGSGAGARVPYGPEEEAGPDRERARFRLDELIAEALSYNRTVAQARVEALISGTVEREAKSALYPTLGARATYTQVDQPPQVVSPELGTTFSTGPKRRWDFGVTADFPIYGFGRHFHAYKAAALSRQRSEADRAVAEADIATAVTAAAFDLLEGYRAIDAALANERAFERQVQDAQALLDAGRVTRAALLDAQVAYDSAVRERERLEAAIPILRMRLNVLLGRPAELPIEVVDEPIQRAPVWKAEGLADAALARRPEMQAARFAVASSERNREAVRGRELPEVRGQLGWDITDSRFTNPEERVTFVLSLDLPIFTAGARPARIRRAEHESDLARIRLRELEAQLRTEVVDALRRVEQSYKDIAVARRSIERSEESQRIQAEKFSQGRATSREVLDATATLRAARFSYVRALYDYNVALYELHRARGGDPREHPFQEVDEAVARERAAQADAANDAGNDADTAGDDATGAGNGNGNDTAGTDTAGTGDGSDAGNGAGNGDADDGEGVEEEPR